MGFIVLIGFLLYILLSIAITVTTHFIGKRLGWRWCKWWLAALIMILIPAWDIPIGKLYFKHLCNTRAGMFVYKTVELEDKYFYKPGDVNKSRLDEQDDYAIAKGGEVNREALRQRYDFNFSNLTVYSNLFRISKRERTIRDKLTDEVLGKSISFIYSGGWLLGGLGGSSHYCGDIYKPTSSDNVHSALFKRIFSKSEY